MGVKRAKKRRIGGAATLGELLEKVYPSRTGYAEVRAHRAFELALTERIKKNAHPARIFRETLYVDVASSAWAHELQMMAPTLLAKLREIDPSLPIRGLSFRTGPVPERVPPPARPAYQPPEGAISDALLAAQVARIRDERSREAFLKAYYAAVDQANHEGR